MFKNIAVLDKKNEIVFERINDEVFCSEFFGQVLTAFESLTKHIADGELSNIEWGNTLITIKKKEDLIFLACTDPDVKENKVNEELDYVCNQFFEIYPIILIDGFNGDRSVFSNSEKRFNAEIQHLID
ncbi:MAG: hypothetical protein ACFE9S_13010 [Candidatus Hermodarchaeota archaeon]